MACTTGELESKEVVNVCDGRRFGCITDFELDPCDGKLKALFVRNGRSIFGKGEDIRIPWDKIVKIGEDTILVDIGSSRDSNRTSANAVLRRLLRLRRGADRSFECKHFVNCPADIAARGFI